MPYRNMTWPMYQGYCMHRLAAHLELDAWGMGPGMASCLKLLLEAGADAEPAPPPPPPPGAPKGPPLKKAPLPMQAICMNDCNEFAELALKELGPRLPGGKPDWTKADDMGRLPLHLAALYNNAYIVKHLLVDAK
ncbi:flagellar associated protein, partial [Haematococcus lacustris]